MTKGLQEHYEVPLDLAPRSKGKGVVEIEVYAVPKRPILSAREAISSFETATPLRQE